MVKNGVDARTTWWNLYRAGQGELIYLKCNGSTDGKGDKTERHIAHGDIDRIESAERDQGQRFTPIQARWRRRTRAEEDGAADGGAEGMECGKGVGERKADKDGLVVECEAQVEGKVEHEVEGRTTEAEGGPSEAQRRGRVRELEREVEVRGP